VIVVRDTREQRGYTFKGYPDTALVRAALHTGDYAPQGYEARCAVERKETGDLINCLCRERRRFEVKLIRPAAELDYFALVVEADWATLARGDYRSAMRPQSVAQSLMAFSVRYHLPIFLAGSRKAGEYITHSLLAKFVREQERVEEAHGDADSIRDTQDAA